MLRAVATLSRRANTLKLAPVLTQTRCLAAGYVESVTELIGATPMIRIKKALGEGVDPSTKVLVKLEMQNPGGSVKDRIAKSMIEDAEARGDISPDRTTIVEATSGNTGIGLAMVRERGRALALSARSPR